MDEVVPQLLIHGGRHWWTFPSKCPFTCHFAFALPAREGDGRGEPQLSVGGGATYIHHRGHQPELSGTLKTLLTKQICSQFYFFFRSKLGQKTGATRKLIVLSNVSYSQTLRS